LQRGTMSRARFTVSTLVLSSAWRVYAAFDDSRLLLRSTLLSSDQLTRQRINAQRVASRRAAWREQAGRSRWQAVCWCSTSLPLSLSPSSCHPAEERTGVAWYMVEVGMVKRGQVVPNCPSVHNHATMVSLLRWLCCQGMKMAERALKRLAQAGIEGWRRCRGGLVKYCIVHTRNS